MRFLFLALLVGCGGGDDGPSCGLASVDGTVMGTQIAAKRAALLAAGTNFQILVDETGAGCGDPGLSGEHLVILFCNKPTATTFPVVDEATFSCPGTNAYAALERMGGVEYAKATGGSVKIESASGCLAGDYMLTFGSETLSGTFDATICN